MTMQSGALSGARLTGEGGAGAAAARRGASSCRRRVCEARVPMALSPCRPGQWGGHSSVLGSQCCLSPASQQLPGHGGQRSQDQVLGPAAALRAHQQHQALPEHRGGLAAALQRHHCGPGQLLRPVSAGGRSCCQAWSSLAPLASPSLGLSSCATARAGFACFWSHCSSTTWHRPCHATLRLRRGGHGDGLPRTGQQVCCQRGLGSQCILGLWELP